MNFILVDDADKRRKAHEFSYSFEDCDERGKGPGTMIQEILESEQFPELEELVIGSWGNSWERGCQKLIDDIVANADRFSHIRKLFIGDMDFEDCEVSWIIQGDYSALWAAMPQLRELTIKGSTELVLGDICHDTLEALTIICGGLSTDIIKSIQNAKLPKLKKLLLYIGVEEYGFDGNESTIRELLECADFPELTYLGICDSEMQDELTKVVLESKFMGQIHTLDLSNGTLSDKGGALLLEKIPEFPNIQKLDLHYNFLSDEMAKKLETLPVEVDSSDRNVADGEEDGEVFMYAMLTE